VGLLGAALTPYEVYFYSSGVVEDGWCLDELGLNRVTAMVGFSLGGFLSLSLMIIAAELFLPAGISPGSLGTPAIAPADALGQVGLLLALVGILFAVGGAAIETCFSGAYNLAQFFGWKWGKRERPAGAPRFTLAWLLIFLLAFLVVMSGRSTSCSESSTTSSSTAKGGTAGRSTISRSAVSTPAHRK
jgi:Mn2+/Fe2+ NRAMP family transporter